MAPLPPTRSAPRLFSARRRNFIDPRFSRTIMAMAPFVVVFLTLAHLRSNTRTIQGAKWRTDPPRDNSIRLSKSPTQAAARSRGIYRRSDPERSKRDSVRGTSGGAAEISCGGHSAASCAECSQNQGASFCNGDCIWDRQVATCVERTSEVHPQYLKLIRHYPFQPVMTDRGEFVNVILVRSPFRSKTEWELYHKYKDEILFLGISSFESYPLSSPNPYSSNFSNDEYLGLFPGFLHMMHNPEAHFPAHVKTILMSQSDFALPQISSAKANDLRKNKVYDFTFSGSDQDIANDCVGWSSFAKNWTFVKDALEVMCGSDFNLKGVLVATKDKKNQTGCSIPASCEGNIVQTPFLEQSDFYAYIKQSRFVFVPQVYDASPRVTTQALALDVPLLMNHHIEGGWKYLNRDTGEFFHDMSDFRESLQRLLGEIDTYQPKRWVTEHYGNEHAGKQLLKFVAENFGDRVTVPKGIKLLLPTGA